MTIQLQTECARSEQINSFLADRLGAQGRHDFLAHLGVCEVCASLLRDLREDERLARVPLTAEERSQVRAIVEQAREQVGVRLESDRGQREQAVEAKPSAPSPAIAPPTPPLAPPTASLPTALSRTTPPSLTVLAPTSARRVVWLALAAALVLAATGWWFFWT